MRVRSVRITMSSLSVGVLLWTTVLFAMGGPALAHETREVGDVVMVVGFGQEPAYAGIPNSVQLLLSDRNEEPILELEEPMTVEVGFGEETMELEVEPRFVPDVFGDPGDYRANFVPSRAGQYTFHFRGTINGEQIDEEFTSGPETFGDVNDPAAQAFPARDPSAAELAERLDRETGRAAGARQLAMAGVVLGGLALVVALAGTGLATRRRRA